MRLQSKIGNFHTHEKDTLNVSFEIAVRWMPQDLINIQLRCQNLFRWWLGTVKQQAMTRTVLTKFHYAISLGHNEWT